MTTLLEWGGRLIARRGWLLVYAIIARAAVEDAARACVAWIRYVCAVDQLQAEAQAKRAAVTRQYRRNLAALDLDVARARARVLEAIGAFNL